MGKDARGLATVSIAALLFLLHKHCGDVRAVRTLVDVLFNRAASKRECSSRGWAAVFVRCLVCTWARAV